MQSYYSVAIVTLLAGLVYFWMALTVARAHSKTGILAPAMSMAVFVLSLGTLGRIVYLMAKQ